MCMHESVSAAATSLAVLVKCLLRKESLSCDEVKARSVARRMLLPCDPTGCTALHCIAKLGWVNGLEITVSRVLVS